MLVVKMMRPSPFKDSSPYAEFDLYTVPPGQKVGFYEHDDSFQYIVIGNFNDPRLETIRLTGNAYVLENGRTIAQYHLKPKQKQQQEPSCLVYLLDLAPGVKEPFKTVEVESRSVLDAHKKVSMKYDNVYIYAVIYKRTVGEEAKPWYITGTLPEHDMFVLIPFPCELDDPESVILEFRRGMSKLDNIDVRLIEGVPQTSDIQATGHELTDKDDRPVNWPDIITDKSITVFKST